MRAQLAAQISQRNHCTSCKETWVCWQKLKNIFEEEKNHLNITPKLQGFKFWKGLDTAQATD